MEVNKLYIKLLLKLLNRDEKININKYQDELIVNMYLTLLSLSNFEYTKNIELKEIEEISDFLRKLNNLKVKIQLKRKASEVNKIAEELIKQYHENVNVLSIYINDGIELENVINTMDAKKITNLIDKVTKNKMNEEEHKEEFDNLRIELNNLLFNNKYYIKNNQFIISDKEIPISKFIKTYNYLLNIDNYKKLYKNKQNQKNHDQIILDIIKILISNNINPDEINKVLIPLVLTNIQLLNIENINELNTSNFNIENIKINELYSLASKNENNNEFNNTPKWRNISIPNEYLFKKLNCMIKKGMYYYKDDNFIFEHLENNSSDFKISIEKEKIIEILKNILQNEVNNNELKSTIISKKNEDNIELNEEQIEFILKNNISTLVT